MNPHGAALQPLLRRFVVAAGAAKRAQFAAGAASAAVRRQARAKAQNVAALSLQPHQF